MIGGNLLVLYTVQYQNYVMFPNQVPERPEIMQNVGQLDGKFFFSAEMASLAAI